MMATVGAHAEQPATFDQRFPQPQTAAADDRKSTEVPEAGAARPLTMRTFCISHRAALVPGRREMMRWMIAAPILGLGTLSAGAQGSPCGPNGSCEMYRFEQNLQQDLQRNLDEARMREQQRQIEQRQQQMMEEQRRRMDDLEQRQRSFELEQRFR
jgi:hypothetical protein